jgi:PKD repeat protein
MAEEAPEIIVNPNAFTFNLDACEGFAESQMHIGNQGGSNLNFEILGGGGSETIELLALTYGVDYYEEYQNTLSAINQYFTDYNLTEVNTTEANVLQNYLIDKDILLIAEQEEGSSYVFSGFSSVLNDYVNNGGCVLFCGTTNYECIAQTGLFSIDSYNNANGDYLDVLDNTHPITEGLPAQIIGVNATYTGLIDDGDAVTLINSSSSPYYDVVTYREIGSGVAIFIAYDYYNYDDHAAQIIAQAVEWGAQGVLPSWLTIEPGNGIVTPSDSTEITIELNSSGMDGGIYETTLNIMSNDPLNLLYEVPITLSVSYDPCADFTFLSEGCNGFTSFFDETTNNPVLWQWDFGDGGTAAIQNPTHIYSSPGEYTVELIACNTTLCDTISYLVDIEETFGPVEAICYPETVNGYSYRGINNVTFNTIYNTTGGSDEGYQDYTCTDYTNVVHGMSYEISVENYDYESVRVWIDYNNNGEFEDEEMVMNSSPQYLHTDMITISSNCVVGEGLRMRVGSESSGYSPPGPCDDVYYGQFEDYTIIVEANTIPPVAMFDFNTIDECQGIVHFSDMSLNLPTEWFWDFGDGETSTYQNPYHTFTTAGIYTVSLTATNEYGSNVITSDVMINSLYPDIIIEGEFEVFKPMTFSTSTIGAISWLWDFGDGYSSNLQNPTYTYTQVGNYTVSLTVQNGVPCTADIYENIFIGLSTGIENQFEKAISIYPNPAQNFFVINANTETTEQIGIKIYDSFGRLSAFYEMDVPIDGLIKKINIDNLDSGMYSIQVFDKGTGEIIHTSKLVVQ